MDRCARPCQRRADRSPAARRHAESSSWQERRYLLTEQPVDYAVLSQRLGLVLTSQRALGFFGGSWTEERLGIREDLLVTRVGPGAAVVVTDRRALGLSADVGGFFETKLRLNEDLESVRAMSSVATITTSQRTLVFRGPSGLWSDQNRTLR